MRAALLRQNLDSPDRSQRSGRRVKLSSLNLREQILAYCPHQTFSHGQGQTRTSAEVCDTTASPSEADMTGSPRDVA